MKDPFVWRFVFSSWWLRRKLQTGSAVPQGSHSIWAMGVVWGSLGPAGLSLAWAPVSPPGAVGHSGSAHPVPCGSQAGGGMCSPEPLMEWDETQEFKQWMAQWATDSAFSCCSKLLPAAAYTVCSALQGMLFLMSVFLVQVVPVSDRAEGDTASLTKIRLESDSLPPFPFYPIHPP